MQMGNTIYKYSFYFCDTIALDKMNKMICNHFWNVNQCLWVVLTVYLTNEALIGYQHIPWAVNESITQFRWHEPGW